MSLQYPHRPSDNLVSQYEHALLRHLQRAEELRSHGINAQEVEVSLHDVTSFKEGKKQEDPETMWVHSILIMLEGPGSLIFNGGRPTHPLFEGQRDDPEAIAQVQANDIVSAIESSKLVSCTIEAVPIEKEQYQKKVTIVHQPHGGEKLFEPFVYIKTYSTREAALKDATRDAQQEVERQYGAGFLAICEIE